METRVTKISPNNFEIDPVGGKSICEIETDTHGNETMYLFTRATQFDTIKKIAVFEYEIWVKPVGFEEWAYMKTLSGDISSTVFVNQLGLRVDVNEAHTNGILNEGYMSEFDFFTKVFYHVFSANFYRKIKKIKDENNISSQPVPDLEA